MLHEHGRVTHALQEKVGIVIGAEGEEPAFGWPFREVLKQAKAGRTKFGEHPDPETLAALIVRCYVTHYAAFDETAGRSADLAALRVAGVANVTKRFRRLCTALLKKDVDHEQVLLAHWYAQTDKSDQFADLRDLCEQLRKRLPSNKAVVTAAGQVIDAVKARLILGGCSGHAYQFSHGLSVYFPWAFTSPAYHRDTVCERDRVGQVPGSPSGGHSAHGQAGNAPPGQASPQVTGKADGTTCRPASGQPPLPPRCTRPGPAT